MYWCEDCKEVVTASEKYDKSTGYKWLECDECGSDYVFSARECICGEWHNPDDNFCPDCQEEINGIVNRAIFEVRKINADLDVYDVADILMEELSKRG